jgi:hypothetical protein
MIILAISAFLLTAICTANAQFAFSTNAGTVTITGYIGFGGEVVVPSLVSGTAVTIIAGSAFLEKTNITSITIPGSVTDVGAAAFDNCSGLTNLALSEGLVTIESNAFLSCTGLTNLAIPDSVTNIGSDSFLGCAGLLNVTIPGSLVTISNGAFAECTHLTNVVIENGVGGIASRAFATCSNLASISIPASVTNIAPDSFAGCGSLTMIMADSSNLFYSSPGGVLFDKNQTTLVEYPDGLSGSYVVPGTVTAIGPSAFENSALTSIAIPDNVTSIGQNAFEGCVSLTNVMLPNSLIAIPNSAFLGCTSLTSIAIPGSVTNIGPEAFQQTGLTSITIPSSVTGIGSEAFLQCSSLAGVFFAGNAPPASFYEFEGDIAATIYYLPGAKLLTNGYAALSVVQWNPVIQTADGNFGVQSNHFGFDIMGTANIPIVVEASTSLAQPVWLPLTNVYLTNGFFYFSDPQWFRYAARYYRISSP